MVRLARQVGIVLECPHDVQHEIWAEDDLDDVGIVQHDNILEDGEDLVERIGGLEVLGYVE